MFSCLLTPSLWRNCCERPLSGYYQKSRTINHYSVNYVVWHFPRISFRLRVCESELRYGTGSGSDRAPLTRSLPLPSVPIAGLYMNLKTPIGKTLNKLFNAVIGSSFPRWNFRYGQGWLVFKNRS